MNRNIALVMIVVLLLVVCWSVWVFRVHTAEKPPLEPDMVKYFATVEARKVANACADASKIGKVRIVRGGVEKVFSDRESITRIAKELRGVTVADYQPIKEGRDSITVILKDHSSAELSDIDLGNPPYLDQCLRSRTLGKVVSGIIGCRQTKQQQPMAPMQVQDKRVTVRMSRISTNEFKLTAQYAGKLDMTWWIDADANLYDASGKEVRARKAGTRRFHCKVNHFGVNRPDNPLKEILVLDMQGLAPGKYLARPSVDIFEYGKDALPKPNDPSCTICPGKVVGVTFTIK